MDNPIKELRLSVGLSQSRLVELSGLSKLVVVRTEQGLYASPSQSLVRPLVLLNPDYTSAQVLREYLKFQEYTRASQVYWVNRVTPALLVGSLSKTLSPVASLRSLAPLVSQSRMGFCKSLCLHPNSIRLLENGSQGTLPSALVVGLKLAKFPPESLDILRRYTSQYAQARSV